MCSTTSRPTPFACPVSEPTWTNPARASTVADPTLCSATRPGEGAVVLDGEQGAVRVAADALVVLVERRAIRRVGSREGRHRDSTGVLLELEEPLEVGVLDHPEAEAHDT